MLMVTESGGVLQPKHAYLFSNVSLKNFVIKKKHRFNLLCELLTKMVIILDSRFLIRAIILFLIIIARYFLHFSVRQMVSKRTTVSPLPAFCLMEYAVLFTILNTAC